jgi:antitoxin CptB
MLELDVLLMPFVDEAFDSLTSDDPDLFAWFMGHQQCQDPELAGMVSTIVNRVKVQG